MKKGNNKNVKKWAFLIIGLISILHMSPVLVVLIDGGFSLTSVLENWMNLWFYWVVTSVLAIGTLLAYKDESDWKIKFGVTVARVIFVVNLILFIYFFFNIQATP